MRIKLYKVSQTTYPVGNDKTITKVHNEYRVYLLPHIYVSKWKLYDDEEKYNTSIAVYWLKYKLWIDLWK